jgi:GT2 family glycosyltransferase
MISIITAIYNQLDLNRLFYESLKRYTRSPFELIIIDNGSTDGSAEFFESNGAKVIRNDGNYSYPFCQNQGIAVASGEILAFLNNDIIVSPDWDVLLKECMREHGLDIITPCGIEQVESPELTRKFKKKWHLIKYSLGSIARKYWSFKLMHKLMYGDWESFCKQRQEKFGKQVIEGFIGNTVVMTRRAQEILGPWDERIQAADFDLYMRSKIRSVNQGDIKPIHFAPGVFIHHYIRITQKSKPPIFKDKSKMIPFDDKWSEADRKLYLKDVWV